MQKNEDSLLLENIKVGDGILHTLPTAFSWGLTSPAMNFHLPRRVGSFASSAGDQRFGAFANDPQRAIGIISVEALAEPRTDPSSLFHAMQTPVPFASVAMNYRAIAFSSTVFPANGANF